ncbi:MAG: thioredoxin family protein [Acidobacteriota bacterium]|nr:thioredoxin family protein [Acidobacteriota bacterium]
MSDTLSRLGDGLVAVVKEDCPTCQLVTPVLEEVRSAGMPLTVITQDDPAFPPGLEPVDDRELEISYRLDVEAVPTLYKLSNGSIVDRRIGWNRGEWRDFTGLEELGADLPEYRPGCGSLSVEPGMPERLRLRFDDVGSTARHITVGADEDPVEACFARGWTDGLPVVPPTPERVERMLGGTRRDRNEIVTDVAPDYGECTVEKVAINAVMAGCLPECLPVVLTAVEAVCTDEFNMHGLAATTLSMGPILIVNGPIRRRIGMNSGMNVLGQGNRANATIGRALQLVVRNVGGARPGAVDRATLGSPAKYTLCFPEDEEASPWESLAAERGVAAGTSSVTVFGGESPRVVVDQQSREPESLARTFASALRTVIHPKLVLGFDAFMVIGPEHARVLSEGGWDKARLREELQKLLTLDGAELVRGAGGIAEGLPKQMADQKIPKFHPDGLWFVHAGGKAGFFSAILGGWVRGAGGTQIVTKEIRE